MRSVALPRRGVVFVALAWSGLLRAQPVTIVNDTFLDGERSTQSLPSSLAWFQNTAQTTNLGVRNGALDLVVANGSRTLLGYFPAVNLQVGESITLTLDFTFTAPVSSQGNFRVGLCYTNGVPAHVSDGSIPTGNYQGYCTSDSLLNGPASLHLNKRNGPAAFSSDAQLINAFSVGDQVLWATIGNGIRGISQFAANHTLVLRASLASPPMRRP
jgi:hypothetical protein